MTWQILSGRSTSPSGLVGRGSRVGSFRTRRFCKFTTKSPKDALFRRSFHQENSRPEELGQLLDDRLRRRARVSGSRRTSGQAFGNADNPAALACGAVGALDQMHAKARLDGVLAHEVVLVDGAAKLLEKRCEPAHVTGVHPVRRCDPLFEAPFAR